MHESWEISFEEVHVEFSLRSSFLKPCEYSKDVAMVMFGEKFLVLLDFISLSKNTNNSPANPHPYS